MTPARRQRKASGLRLAVGLVVLLATANPLTAETGERIVTDRHSGIAIHGFDPVAYFTDGKARAGSAEYELGALGVSWRFRNEGNRAAFRDAPESYAPQFGGHDPVVLARGKATPGHPEIFLLSGTKLYFFYSEAARDIFAADLERNAEMAEAKWRAVSRDLNP